jgi:hypothetical protein
MLGIFWQYGECFHCFIYSFREYLYFLSTYCNALCMDGTTNSNGDDHEWVYRPSLCLDCGYKGVKFV